MTALGTLNSSFMICAFIIATHSSLRNVLFSNLPNFWGHAMFLYAASHCGAMSLFSEQSMYNLGGWRAGGGGQ